MGFAGYTVPVSRPALGEFKVGVQGLAHLIRLAGERAGPDPFPLMTPLSSPPSFHSFFPIRYNEIGFGVILIV
jgi:hypothetical protein